MTDKPPSTLGFKAPADLIAQTDAVARGEGITRSAVARRALMRDLAGAFGAPPPGTEKRSDAA